nr:hypothetical protein [Embleya scabrispora]
MQEAHRVHVVQGVEELAENRRRVRLRQRAVVADQRLQRPAREQLHRDQDIAVGHPRVGRRDMPVLQPEALFAHHAQQ